MFFLLAIVPTILFHLLVAAGIAAILGSIFLKMIPFVDKYYIVLRIVGFVALLFGIFFEGATANQKAWEDKVKELEEKIRIAENRSIQENIKIVEKVVIKKEYYKERGKDLITYVDREIVKLDDSCKIPQEVVNVHNKAASPGESK